MVLKIQGSSSSNNSQSDISGRSKAAKHAASPPLLFSTAFGSQKYSGPLVFVGNSFQDAPLILIFADYQFPGQPSQDLTDTTRRRFWSHLGSRSSPGMCLAPIMSQIHG